MALLASIVGASGPMHAIHDVCFRRCLQHETSFALVEGMMCLAACACVHVHDVQCMCICLVLGHMNGSLLWHLPARASPAYAQVKSVFYGAVQG